MALGRSVFTGPVTAAECDRTPSPGQPGYPALPVMPAGPRESGPTGPGSHAAPPPAPASGVRPATESDGRELGSFGVKLHFCIMVSLLVQVQRVGRSAAILDDRKPLTAPRGVADREEGPVLF